MQATATATEKAMVGQPAPDFDMGSTKNIEKLNENVKLSDYKGKWLVLLFYPLDFTFVCPTELTTFSDRYKDFEAIGADIIGVSTDSVFSHRAWIQTPRGLVNLAGRQMILAPAYHLKDSVTLPRQRTRATLISFTLSHDRLS